MISADLQSLSAGNLIVLYELDLTPIGSADHLYFFSDQNPLGNSLVWCGQTYTRYPVEAEGFERTGTGAPPRPKLRVANLDGLIGKMGRDLGGMEGAKLIRTRTFMKYLDAVNFEGGNPSADPNQYIEREIWIVSRRSAENLTAIEYELAAPFDVGSVMLPRRQVIQNACMWVYRGADCGYTGAPVADAMDQPTSDLASDKCGRRLSSCKLRFGTAPLPFGGFPGAGQVKTQ